MNKKINEKTFEVMTKWMFVIMILFVLLFANNFFRGIHWLIDLGEFYGDMPPSEKAYYIWNYPCQMIESVSLMITAVLSCVILMRCLKAKTPFVPKIGKYLRIIAVTIAAALLLMFAVRIIAETVSGAAPYREYQGFLNGGDMIFISILIMLSYIFDRGFELQQESDETL